MYELAAVGDVHGYELYQGVNRKERKIWKTCVDGRGFSPSRSCNLRRKQSDFDCKHNYCAITVQMSFLKITGKLCTLSPTVPVVSLLKIILFRWTVQCFDEQFNVTHLSLLGWEHTPRDQLCAAIPWLCGWSIVPPALLSWHVDPHQALNDASAQRDRSCALAKPATSSTIEI